MATDTADITVLENEALARSLSDLEIKLASAVTITEAQNVSLDAAAAAVLVPQLVAETRLILRWMNRLCAIRLRAMRRIGELLIAMEKNRGGNPNLVKGDGPKTLKDLGIGYTHASECQRMARMPLEAFEAYLALGENADDDMEPVWAEPHHNDFRPYELTKRDLLKIASNYVNAEAGKARRAAAAQQAAAETLSRVDALGGADPEPEVVLTDNPEPPPPAPQPPAQTRIKSMLRRAVDPTANPQERETALRKVQQIDPRLESLDDTLANLYHKRDTINHEQYRKLYEENESLRKEVERLQRRDRQQVQTIRLLREELRQLTEERDRSIAAPTSDDVSTVPAPEAPAGDDEPSAASATPPADDGAAAAEPADSSAKQPSRAGLVKEDQVRASRIAPNYAPPQPGSGSVKNNGMGSCPHRGRGKAGCPHIPRCHAAGECLALMSALDNVPRAA